MKNEQKKHKFNAVDAIIIIAIAAVIGTAVFFFRGQNDKPKDDETQGQEVSEQAEVNKVESVQIEYEIEFRTVRNDLFADKEVITKEDVLGKINVGDRVKDVATLDNLGRIVEVTVEPAKYTGTDIVNGVPVVSDYPYRSNIKITISADATVGDMGRFRIDGEYDVSVGVGLNVRMKNFTGTAYCTEIRTVGGANQ